MFNSFLDGTKSAIEMAAVANACLLEVHEDGLAFPPCGVDDLATVLRPRRAGGVLETVGMVEVVSSLQRSGAPVPGDLRWGVYVVLEAPNTYTAGCFAQYGLRTDDSGRFAAMYRPYHLIGLELSISVLNAALRGEATGSPQAWLGDVAAISKRPLRKGEILDGEGGYTVFGKLISRRRSLDEAAMPIGLAEGATLQRDLGAGAMLTYADVAIDESSLAVRVRRQLEAEWATGRGAAAV
jgi:predicted homoserine dehydrogenase-like protein